MPFTPRQKYNGVSFICCVILLNMYPIKRSGVGRQSTEHTKKKAKGNDCFCCPKVYKFGIRGNY